MKKAIHTDRAPKAVGPYSQAVWAGNLLLCSGQIPLDPVTGQLVTGSIQEQTQRVLDNIRAVLESQSLNFSHVVKTTIFLKSMADFANVNEVYASAFQEPYPARSTVAVKDLPKDAQVEIEVIAMRDEMKT